MIHQSELERLAYRLGGVLTAEEMGRVMPVVRKWAQELGKGTKMKWTAADVHAEWVRQNYGPMWQVACTLGVSEKTVARKLKEYGINNSRSVRRNAHNNNAV